MTGTKTNKTYN